MQTLRFEGPTLEDAVEVARAQVGQGARIVGATRVRRGGVAGFFAREHVEVEVVLETAPAEGGPLPLSVISTAPAPVTPGLGPGVVEPRTAPGWPPRQADPLADLIDEMAGEPPTSVLDLAERLDTTQSHYDLSLEPQEPAWPDEEAQRLEGRTGLGDSQLPVAAAAELDLAEEPAGLEQGTWDTSTEVTTSTEGTTEVAAEEVPFRSLGLPESVLEELDRLSGRLEERLAEALRNTVPPPPSMPLSANCVVAVVGEPDRVMSAAQAIARELGAPDADVVLVTRREVAGVAGPPIATPEGAADERRSWRWRERPSVVAVESPVRPNGNDWVAAMLRALEPTMCWGVADALRKPEDLVAWSGSLGGLDALELVDLERTVSPASALSGPVPVGRLDGGPATPESWARVLVARLSQPGQL